MVQHFGRVDGIILETTATNAQDVSEAVVPWYAKIFVSPQVAESLSAYDMVETLKDVEAPILILGAAKDKTLPVELSRKLAEGLTSAGRDLTYIEFSEGNHISVPTQANYRAAIEGFIAPLNKAPQSEISLNRRS